VDDSVRPTKTIIKPIANGVGVGVLRRPEKIFEIRGKR